MHLPSCATLAACLVSLASAASLQRVNNFGNNPTNTKMFIYVPDNRPAGVKPAILVAVHHCQGTAQSYFGSTPYAKLADQYKYIVIYPESPYSGTCWDISSKAALTHGGGADTTSIANMVTYTIQQYGADANRVYVQGGSSGAMMANVLAATYPEMFKAVIAYAGVAAGCFVSSNPNSQAAWNGTCSGGNSIGTQQSWANVVRNMYPGYNGARPKMMIYHGSADTTINPRNYNETIKQWTGVFGYSLTPQQTLSNTPARGYTKYIYGPNVIGIYGSGVGHGIPVFQDEDMAFYGFKGGNEPQNPPTTTPPTSSPTTNPPPTGCSGLYGQCGGKDWTGPKCCSQGSCNVTNEWYSQCL